MSKKEYFILSDEQTDKIGNAIIYLSKAMGALSKTKILKLLYILDEISIKKSGIPFFNLPYKVWQFGPVAEDVFIDLSSGLTKLSPYIEKREDDLFSPIADFNNDEFTNNDIKLMDFIVENFGHATAKELIDFTHRENSPWYQSAVENNVLDLLKSETISHTEYVVDFLNLIGHDDRKKMIYEDYLEMH